MADVAGPSKERSGLGLAVGDALATAFFVFVSSTFDEVAFPHPVDGSPGRPL